MASSLCSMSDTSVPGFDDLAEIGRGGFGVVYRAPQQGFGRDVAIKVLTGASSRLDDRARRRFERETATTGQLSSHPHIVTLHQAGFTDDNRPYLVMAFHERGSLGDRLERSGPLPWQDVADIGVSLAGALATAHAAGIVHRDVKPDNVLLDDFGSPVLTDFGIASVTGPDTATLTSTGQMTMTVAFSPPEVLDGARPDERTDVFALGATLFALLTGHPPFVRPGDESVAQVIARMVREDPPDLAAEGIPQPLAEAIDRALAKDPTQRTPNAIAFGQQLQDAQRATGLPPTRMTLPEAIDAGRAAERTLALPGVVLGTPLHTDEPVADVTGAEQADAAARPTAPLGSAPALTPTTPLDHGGSSGGQRTPTQSWPTHPAASGQATHYPQATPVHSPPPSQPGRGRSTTGAVLIGLLVGLVVLAGGAFAWLQLGGDDTEVAVADPTTPTATPAVGASAADPDPTIEPVATPTPTIPPAPAPPGATTEPTSDPTAAPTIPPAPPAPPAPDVILLADHPQGPAVASTLQQWHDGINVGDYALAFDAYTVGLQQQVGFTQFSDGNQTSTILSPVVEVVTATGGGLDTTISFRSLQAAEWGPDGQTCSDWRLRWRMVEVDGRWLVDDVDALDGSPYGC